MITTGFDSKVKIQQIVENQLPEFITVENPKSIDFLKQYYISQEFQGGSVDLAENLNQYLKLDNFTPDVIAGVSTLRSSITPTDTVIEVSNTKGFPQQYGLLKIDDEIITYTGITTNSFTGCKRGFSGIVSYRSSENPEELEFSTSQSASHSIGSNVENLSSLFLKEFYKKIKQSLAPGFENKEFVSDLNVNNFIKEINTFYKSKGTEESFRILYKVLYGVDPRVINLEEFLVKSSNAEFIRREVIVTELISGENPNNLVGQVIKNSENTASAPVSEVEIIKRNGRNFYKIQLFAGFNEKSLIEGTFEITPKTKIVDKVEVNDTVITVDSTIGFPQSGTLICGTNVIKYTDKSINQFLNCSGVETYISPSADIRSDNIIYGYENGDINKKVLLRITGVLSDLKNQNDIYFRSINDNISVKNVGDKIINPENNKTYKEFIFNSWIYNTSSRYEISSFNDNQIILHEIPDKSSLRVGDFVNILHRNSEDIIVEDAIVTNILNDNVFLNKNITGISPNTKISIRRNINYAKSSGIDLKYQKIFADIQNTYNEDDKFIYVASNSLPSYNISKSIVAKTIQFNSTLDLDSIFSGAFTNSDGVLKYSILSFDTEIPFITGDSIVYTGTGSPIDGLIFNEIYYVEVIEPASPSDLKNKIKLYNSRSFLKTDNFVQFSKSSLLLNSQHTFTLEQQSKNKKLSPKKILRKFPLNQNIASEIGPETPTGSTGMLINGVEIINYKSNDFVYYGPLSEIKILNSGVNYDVINPPEIIISNPSKSSGTRALANVCVRGNLKDVVVDPNELDIEKVISISLTGGNGSGAVVEPIIENKFKEIQFNGQLSKVGGGIDEINETITFLDSHQLENGIPIVYSSNGNFPIGIGTFEGSNTDQNRYLVDGSIYYPKIVNTKSIKLYNKVSDLNLGINTVGFTTANNGGIHKFRLLEGKSVLTDIKVVNSGEGYENRRLIVRSSGISTY